MTREEKIQSDYEAYNRGVIAGKLHSKPSPETLRYMENVTIQIADLKEDLKDIPRKADMELFVTKAITLAIQENMCACDKKYAPRYVATVLNLIASTCLIALIGGIVKYIFDHIQVLASNII